jgi:hypothetical protein
MLGADHSHEARAQKLRDDEAAQARIATAGPSDS